MTWAAALSAAEASTHAGYIDWRLPNIKELRSLVEECRGTPAINDTVFPGASSSGVWSGSPSAYDAPVAWGVDFYGGYAFYSGSRSDAYSVRLVRGGPYFINPASVSSLAPVGARLDVAQTLLIVGTNFLSGATTVAFDDCPLVPSTVAAPNPVITPTQITVSCTPQLPGSKRLLINGAAVANRNLFVDHPTRMGNPAARGIPAVNGVSLFNGNFFHEVADMSVPGKGIPFTLQRSYNSYYWREEAKRGTVDNYKPWRFNWETEVGYVAGTNSKQLYVEQADGSGRSFYQHTDNNWYAIDQGSFDAIKFDDPSVGFFTFYERNGVKQVFESPTTTTPGRLKVLRDHASNQLQVTHDATTRLVSSVTDTVGRVFDFTYYPTGDAAGRAKLLKRVQYTAATALHTSGWYVEYDWFADTAPETGLPRARLKAVRDLRGQTWTYNYVDKAAQPSYSLSSRVFLSSLADPRGNTVLSLSHAIGVFGNWGVDRVDNGESNYWNFQYCAKQADASCGGVTAAVSFENKALPPLSSGQGNRIARFDVAGRVTAVVDGSGNTTAVTPRTAADLTPQSYNLAGLTLAQQSQLGNATGYAYTPDNAGNLSARTDALSKQWSAAYTLSNSALLVAKNLHLPATTTTPTGLVRGFEFDTATGVNTKRTDPGGAFSTSVPNALGQITQSVDQRSKQTDYAYTVSADNLGGANVSRITLPADAAAVRATEDMKYDTLGRVRWRKDALGAVTETEYNEAGQVRFTRKRRTEAGAVERTVEQGYDLSGNVAYRIDARGQRTEFAYDRANRLTTTTVKANAALGMATDIVSTNTYDTLGRLWKTTNPNLHDSKSGFDAVGNVNSRSDHLNDATTYLYDADNRLKQVTDPEGRATKYEYDAVGRTRFVETNAGANVYRVERRYDSDGRITNLIEAHAVGGRKNETQYVYHDATSPCAVCKGQLWKVFDATQTGLASPQASSTTLYDEAGNVTAITDPRGNTTTITYDGLNREISRTYPGTTNTTAKEYNLAGQVTRVLASGTEKSRNTYDEFGQLSRTDYVGGFAAFTYDNNGNRLTMADNIGTTSYVYDGLSRLTKITDVYGKVLEFAYDATGNRTGIKYPNGQWVYYDFDAAERMNRVRPWWATSAAQYTSYTLDKSGRVKDAAIGNGTTAHMEYDSAGRMNLLENKSTNVPGGFISKHALTLDENGNWASVSNILPLELSVTATSTSTMTFDAANRVQSLTSNGVTSGIGYDTAGRVSTLSRYSYTYDGRDLLTRRFDVFGAGTPNYNGTNFAHNGSGHRVQSETFGQVNRFVIDPNPANPTLQNVLTQTDVTGVPLRHYVYGYGLLAQASASDVVSYYHFDPTGNTLALTNTSGAITDTYAYTPYGETTALGATTNPFRFNGKHGVMDDGDGHLHMRARTYRPDIARFLSLDAVTGEAITPQSLNQYAFVQGAPLRRVDPDGNVPTFAEILVAGDSYANEIGRETFKQLVMDPILSSRKRIAECSDSMAITNWQGSWAYRTWMTVAETTTTIVGCAQIGAVVYDAFNSVTFYKNPALMIKILVNASIESMSDLSADEKIEFKYWVDSLIDAADIARNWGNVTASAGALRGKAASLKWPKDIKVYQRMLRAWTTEGGSVSADSLKFVLDFANKAGLFP